MPRLRYNLAEIPDFVKIEPGRYRARLGAVVKQDSRSGNPMLVWTWTLLEGPNKASKVKSYTSLQEQALGGLKQHLLAFGLKGKVDASTDDLVDEKATIVLAEEPGESRDGTPQMFTRVVAVLPLRKKSSDDEDEEEERPAKKKAKVEEEEEEEEEERPRKKKAAAVEEDDDDDEEEKPIKKKKAAVVEDDEETEEEEKPRKKLKKVARKDKTDEDDEDPF